MQKVRKSGIDIRKIYEDLKFIQTLHKIKEEAIYNCYDENKDYGHVFVLDDIYSKRLDKIIKEIESQGSFLSGTCC